MRIIVPSVVFSGFLGVLVRIWVEGAWECCYDGVGYILSIFVMGGDGFEGLVSRRIFVFLWPKIGPIAG